MDIDDVRLGPPVRFVVGGVISALGLLYLPNEWWGILVKVILGYWLIATIYSSFRDTWHKYKSLGAFVTIQTAAITAAVYFANNFLICTTAIFISLIGWTTMLKKVRDSNNGKLTY